MYGGLDGAGFEALDSSFNECIIGHARVERLWTGARWSEGPAWFPAGRYVVWSDIPNNRLMRWDETDGSVSVFRHPSYGILMDYEGARAEVEQNGCHLYRVDPVNGIVTAVTTDFVKPNCLAFSADEKVLFVSDPGG